MSSQVPSREFALVCCFEDVNSVAEIRINIKKTNPSSFFIVVDFSVEIVS
jgi:hypothetical protein